MSIQPEIEKANAEFVAAFTDGDKPMPPARRAVRFHLNTPLSALSSILSVVAWHVQSHDGS